MSLDKYDYREDPLRRSLAWWLSIIKSVSRKAKCGVNTIARAAHVNWAEANPAIKDLLASGYLEVEGNIHKSYKLSSLGHRYLNEHPVPDEETNEAAPSASGPSYRVPSAPGDIPLHRIEEAPTETKPVYSDIIENPTPRDWETPGAKIRLGTGYHYVSEPEAAYNRAAHQKALKPQSPPSAVEPGKPGLPAPSQGIIVPPKPKSLKAEFRRVLVDILLEQYAGQVTAAEVMQRLEVEHE